MIKTILDIVPPYKAQYSSQTNGNVYMNQACLLKYFIHLAGTHHLVYDNPMEHQ